MNGAILRSLRIYVWIQTGTDNQPTIPLESNSVMAEDFNLLNILVYFTHTDTYCHEDPVRAPASLLWMLELYYTLSKLSSNMKMLLKHI